MFGNSLVVPIVWFQVSSCIVLISMGSPTAEEGDIEKSGPSLVFCSNWQKKTPATPSPGGGFIPTAKYGEAHPQQRPRAAKSRTLMIFNTTFCLGLVLIPSPGAMPMGASDQRWRSDEFGACGSKWARPDTGAVGSWG
jgi:hypothetical protein